MRLPIPVLILAIVALSAAAADASAQAERRVHWTLEPPAGAGVGGALEVRLDARIDRDWYLYAPTQPGAGPYPMRVEVDPAGGWRLVADIRAPRPRRFPDRNFNMISEVYRGTAEFFLPVASPPPGAEALTVLVRYQACTRTYCLPPRTDTLRWGDAATTGDIAHTAADQAPTAPAAPGTEPSAPSPADPAAAPALPPGEDPVATPGERPGADPVPDPDEQPGSSPVVDPDAGPGASPVSAQPEAAATPAGADVDDPAAVAVVVPAPRAGDAAGSGSGSLLRFLLLAAAMGLLSLLTPCVLPLVPLTVGFFARLAGGDSLLGPVPPRGGAAGGDVVGSGAGAGEGGAGRRQPVRPVGQALAFGLGMVLTFALVGLVVTALFGAAGILRLATNPWVNLALAGLFVAFGLNLLGVYEVTLPAGLTTRLSAIGSGAAAMSLGAPASGSANAGAPAGAVLVGAAGYGSGSARQASLFGVASRLALLMAMGGAFAVTSFTCTAPFVGTLLVLATQGDAGWPLAGLGTYALAFATPFVLLALSPGALRRMPRSGAWMRTMLRAVGVIVLAAALKFVSNASMVAGWGLLPRERFIGLWLLAVLALAWVFLSGLRTPGARRAPRLVAAGVALLLATWLATGLGGRPLGELEAYLPPPAAGHRATEGPTLAWWLNDYDGALAQARSQGRPLFVDFTGYTCTNCRWMEANMFPRPEVHALLDRYVLVRLYTDGRGEPYRSQQRFQERTFGTVALPYYVIISGDGAPVATFLGMTRSTHRFATFLDDGLRATSSNQPTGRP